MTVLDIGSHNRAILDVLISGQVTRNEVKAESCDSVLIIKSIDLRLYSNIVDERLHYSVHGPGENFQQLVSLPKI